MAQATCSHLEAVTHRRTEVRPSAPGCTECLASGDIWVHLRLCLECGHVGCCDDSPNKHASMHHRETHHPVIRSYEPGESWGYCYVDDVLVEHVRAFPAECAPVHYAPPR